MGAIIGTPGKSLLDTTANGFTSSTAAARFGARGEISVGNVLNKLAVSHTSAFAFHDLRIPCQKIGYNANIDHVIVCGNDVYLIDAKNWAQGTYFGFGKWRFRKTLNGKLERFMPAETGTLRMAYTKFDEYLKDTPAKIRGVYVVVVSKTPIKTILFSVKGSKVMSIEKMQKKLENEFSFNHKEPDERILQKLRRLVA
jgi:hypothetical protein